MQYLLLIYSNESAAPGPASPQFQAGMKAYADFTSEIMASKNLLGGNRLQSAATTTSVRVRDGKTLLTDGPFAETAEQLGGYYVIQAANLDEALGIAARVPGAQWGTIEVRPIHPMQPPA
jgi:hypothetical protein